MPDRFSADEARRIFARAARRQHAAPTPDGLTVEDLEAIGREAGLDPALIAAEAAAERLGDGHEKTWHGVPVGIRRARLMPARISDREWERIVDLLRAEFKMEGTAQQIGTRREWATGTSATGVSSMSSAYKVRVEERSDGDLVTIEAPNTNQLLGYVLGGTFGGMAAFVGILIATLQPEKVTEALAMLAVMLTIAAVSYGSAWLGAKVSAARTPDRFEALLDRIDLASRAERPPSAPLAAPEPAAPAGRIDPGHLDAERDLASAPAASRSRTRA